jgi:hypothetical protein
MLGKCVALFSLTYSLMASLWLGSCLTLPWAIFSFIRTMLEILRHGPMRTPTLREVEERDAVFHPGRGLD